MLTMPISSFPSSTGTWRTRFLVISTLSESTVSFFVQVAILEVMILDTGRDNTLAPCLWSSRTTSRSDTIPTTPSAPTTTMAPMFCSARPASSALTVASGLIVTTAAPLFRKTSAIRIEPPSRCDLLHTRLRLTRAAGKTTRAPTTDTLQYPQTCGRNPPALAPGALYASADSRGKSASVQDASPPSASRISRIQLRANAACEDRTMIEVILLGTGSPVPDPNRAGPSSLVRAGGQVFLVDCGRGVLQRAAAVGVGAAGLSALLLTHLHSDHIGDLGDVLITRWVSTFAPDPAPLPIIGPPGTADTVEATLNAFRHDISYRIAHHADLNAPPAVEVHEYTKGPVWDRDGVSIRVAPTDHRPVAPTIGFRIEFGGASVVLAGDTVRCSSLDELATAAGALVHTVIRKDIVSNIPQQRLRDICDYHSSVEEAAATAARAGVGTLVMTHYVPALAPGQEEQWRALAAGVFGGRLGAREGPPPLGGKPRP